MKLTLTLWRDGQELGELEDYGVALGPVEWTVGERCEFRAPLIHGRLEPGDWIQVYLDGQPCGRFWFWAAEWTWTGDTQVRLELGSADRVLELAQVYTPGVLSGIQGDSVVDGLPLTNAVQEICGALGLDYRGPTIDRVAAGDYAWDFGTPFRDVVDQILGAIGLRWVAGRRGEVLAYKPPLGPAVTVGADEVHELSVRPALDALANVVVVERDAASQPGEAAVAVHDDPASLTSTVRFVPRVFWERGVTASADALRDLAQTTLEERRRLGGEGTLKLRARNDLWPGNRLRIVGVASRVIEADVAGIRFAEGASTIDLEVKTEVYAWPDAT